MASVVDICNKALSILGQKSIVSLDDTSPEAYACRIHWEPLRDEILRGHPWNCALKRAGLNRLVEVPAYGYDYYYQLPSDCLTVLNIEPEGFFEIEGRKLLSSQSEVSIRYIQQTNDTTKFDSQLSAALSYLLAAELSYNMTRSTSATEVLYAKGMEKLSEAKASDAFEGKTRSKRQSRWLDAKYR